jgi:hypothetical protein
MAVRLLVPVVLAALVLVGSGVPVIAADSPTIGWQTLTGGFAYDEGRSIHQTSDGGYIMLGRSKSSESGDVTGVNHGLGNYDLWLVRMDAGGAIRWQRLLGGTGNDQGESVWPTADGGYILLGTSDSYPSGNVTAMKQGGTDLWLVKLDSHGLIQWQRMIGGTKDEFGTGVRQTADGGYVVLGYSDSFKSGNVTVETHGGWDVWVLKCDPLGEIQWQSMLGGSANDKGNEIEATDDGGFVLVGTSRSSASGNVKGVNHGREDPWAVKLSSGGTIQWESLLGGSDQEFGDSVRQCGEGYLFLGESYSSGSGDVTGTNHGSFDLWVVNLDDDGSLVRQELLGSGGADVGCQLDRTSDGGSVLLGTSMSSGGGNVTGPNHGMIDLWVVRLDPGGRVRWDRLLGGNKTEEGYNGASIRQTSDGGYVLVGNTESSANGDVAGANHGGWDVWVVKLAGESPVVAVPGASNLARDLDGDGKYEDVNGNGRKDFADVTLYFTQMTWIGANEPLAAFDYNGNGRIDFADVTWIFNHL